MDRFPLSFNEEHVFIDTSQLIHVPRTSNLSGASRLLAPPQVPCMSYPRQARQRRSGSEGNDHHSSFKSFFSSWRREAANCPNSSSN
jgi:hypothetical protein